MEEGFGVQTRVLIEEIYVEGLPLEALFFGASVLFLVSPCPSSKI